MCEDTPHNIPVVCWPYQPQKLTTEAAQLLRAHLAQLQHVAPKQMRAACRWHQRADAAHGPTKTQQLHPVFPKPWPQTQASHRVPHQPANASQLCPTPPRSHPSHRAASSVCTAQRTVRRRRATCRHNRGDEVSTDGCAHDGAHRVVEQQKRPAVHTPVSHAVYTDLMESMKHLSPVQLRTAPAPAPAHQAAVTIQNRIFGQQPEPAHTQRESEHSGAVQQSSAGGEGGNETSHSECRLLDAASCRPLIQPASPKPRKKVWKYRPYSLHAPCDPRAARLRTSQDFSAIGQRKRKR